MKQDTESSSRKSAKNFILFIGFLLLISLLYLLFTESKLPEIFNNQEKIRLWVSQLGLLGPIAVVLLIATAIIVTPIPSAPVALVSGALYGHYFGTLYVVLGALLGAVIAFMISRHLGYDYVSKKLHNHMPEKIVGSQNMLMMLVFATRLAPFISFDVISYAAGLTPLTYKRFIFATVMGILPISFILAHLGSEARTGEMESIAIALLLLGFITLTPLIFSKVKNYSKGK